MKTGTIVKMCRCGNCWNRTQRDWDCANEVGRDVKCGSRAERDSLLYKIYRDRKGGSKTERDWDCLIKYAGTGTVGIR